MADDHKRILVTGAAGFIGSYVSRALLERGHAVRGIDNFSPYYDPQLKRDRLAQLPTRAGFSFDTIDIADRDGLQKAFEAAKPDIVVHLAAQVGIRYPLENPQAFVDANLVGFANVLEECRHLEVERLVYASSSSVLFQIHPPAYEGQPLPLYNRGNHETVNLRALVRLLESLTGRQSLTEELPMQP